MGKKKRRQSAADEDDLCIHARPKLGLPELDRMNIMDRLQFKFSDGRRNYSSSPTTSRRRKINSCNMIPDKDIISKLPDHILKFIISGLSTGEGAATCLLSRRWRDLCSSLNFDIRTMLGYDYIQHQRVQPRLASKISEFTQWGDRVFKHPRASSLDALRICFLSEKGYAPHIDRWIKSAAAEGVSDIELDLSFDQYSDLRFKGIYEFHSQQASYSSLKYLRLRHCIFHLPPDFTGFTSLISLSLHHIENVTQCLVDNILSKCPLLECLSLVKCSVLDATILKFSGPSLQLKHLDIESRAGRLKEIEVHDINILSLELRGMLVLTLKNVPHLARLVFLYMLPIVTLSDIPRLEILFMPEILLARRGFQHGSILPPTYPYNNLKRLVIVSDERAINPFGVVYLLETFHLLQELEINMGYLPTVKYNVPETLSKFRTPYNNLKKIEIYAFEARPERIELVKCLLKYAVVLDSMKISVTRKTYQGNGNWTLHQGTAEEKKLLKKVHQELRKVARSSTKLEVSSSLDL